jgi:hypothetical protein
MLLYGGIKTEDFSLQLFPVLALLQNIGYM